MLTVLTAFCVTVLLFKARSFASFSHAQAPQSTLTNSRTRQPVNASSVLTDAPKFRCENQDQDPGLGILSPFCICDETISLPEITPHPDFGDLTLSCAYKSSPTCQTCSSMGMVEGGCSPIPNCNSHAKSPASSTKTRKVTLSQSSTKTQKKSSSTTLTQEQKKHSSASSTRTQKGATAAKPFEKLTGDYRFNSSLSLASTCLLQDQYCLLQGSEHASDGLREDCILWNNSCGGNKTLAASKFFPGPMGALIRNRCFVDPSPDCTTSNPPGRMSAFAEAKNWMRSPECFAAQIKQIFGDHDLNAVEHSENTFFNDTCCGGCEFVADNIDVYFWPDAHADSSCQSIIGDGVSDVAYGVTSDGSNLYWGCTSFGPGTSSIVTTAILTTVANITFRDYIFNPWEESPCGNMSVSSQLYTTANIQQRDIKHSLNPRAHTLIATNGNASTVVQGHYTFTSPSVYISFEGLHAGDQCGTTSFLTTMLAFSLGELSTIIGPPDHRFSSSRQFNPADLPCPPQSIMSENWYTPLPGIPYRPFFAFPEKLRQIAPSWKHCNAFWFHAFDPPHALIPASTLAGPTTINEPTTPSVAPEPIPVLNPGARQTADASPTSFASYAPQADPLRSGPLPQQSGSTLQSDPANDPTNDPPKDPAKDPANDPTNDPPKDPAKDPANDPTNDPPKDPAKDPATSPEASGALPVIAPDPQQSPPPNDPPQGPPGYPLQDPLAQQPQHDHGNDKSPWTGSSPVDSPIPPPPTPAVLTLGTAIFTPNPTAFPIAGTTLSAGGPGIVVSGTPVSLNPAGSLIIDGTRTIPLQTPAHSSIITAGGHAFTLQPGGLVAVDGTTLSSGGPGTTIAGGMSVSVGSGSLIVGSQTISLPAASASLHSSGTLAFEGDAAALGSVAEQRLMMVGCWLLVVAISSI